MYQVIKRDGKHVDFDLSKITEAIRKAFEAQERQYNMDIIELLALKVTADFEKKIKDGLIGVEDIQDSVEAVLIAADYADVAKGYILYRKQREKIRNMKSTVLDYKEIVDNYVHLTGLAREGKLHRDLFRRRPDLKQLRCDHGKLLAFGDL